MHKPGNGEQSARAGGVEETRMTKARDFMTSLLAKFKVTHAKKLRRMAVPVSEAVPKSKPYIARQVTAYRPKPPPYRRASNM
jgi:hypothetical protein